MKNLAQDLIQKLSQLHSDRSTFENHWSEVAPVVLTRQDTFQGINPEKGERRGKDKYDDTASLALQRGSAAIEGILIPRGQKWHHIKPPEDIVDDHETEVWADDLRDFLFRMRYSSRGNFASQAHEYITGLLAFGTAIMAVEDVIGKGIRYKNVHLVECHICENNLGKVDTIYRKYKLTARQAKEKFGDKAPPCVEKYLEKKPTQELEFLHVVMPDLDNVTRQPFVSYHVSIEDTQLIDVGAFKSFPYIVSRWVTAPNEVYGRSPAMTVLNEIKMLQQMRKTDLKARHLAVSPPILAADQATIRKLSMQPEKINYGALDAAGNQLVRPYVTGVDLPASNDGMEQSREFINDAFFVTLFQILVDAPTMTATEVLQRAQEKGVLLSPTAGRQLSEFLTPLIEREINIYEGYGIFEDDGILEMPEAMKEYEGEFDIEFTNPLTRMMSAEDGLATSRTVESLVPLAQIDPSILDPIDWKEYADIMRIANGAPARLFKSEDRLAEEAEAKAQQMQMQQMVEAAPQVAGAMKDIASAQSISEGAGQPPV